MSLRLLDTTSTSVECLLAISCALQEDRTDTGYMAPEMMLAEAAYSIASDLWALACTIYQMATGSLPFQSMPQFHTRRLLELQRPKGPAAPHQFIHISTSAFHLTRQLFCTGKC